MSELNNKKQGSDKLFVIRYEWVLKHLPFFLFLSLLAIVYIANGHWADNTISDINHSSKRLKDLQYEYKSLKSIEMFRSREAQVVNAAAPLGLKISAEPPIQLNESNEPINQH